MKITINTNPKTWPVLKNENLTVVPTDEKLVEVCIGTADYDFQGEWDIVIFVRKSIYDKLISGEYIVRDGEEELVVEGKQGNIIPPLNTDGKTIY
jgi:hypothetical protein